MNDRVQIARGSQFLLGIWRALHSRRRKKLTRVKHRVRAFAGGLGVQGKLWLPYGIVEQSEATAGKVRPIDRGCCGQQGLSSRGPVRTGLQ